MLSESLADVELDQIAEGVFDLERTLVSGFSPEGRARLVDTQSTITVLVDGTVVGDSGCGRYTGRYRPRPPKVAIRELEVTDDGCRPRNRGAGAVVVAGLRDTTCMDLTSDGSLVLHGPGTRLEFALVDASARGRFKAAHSGREPQGLLTCTGQ